MNKLKLGACGIEINWKGQNKECARVVSTLKDPTTSLAMRAGIDAIESLILAHFCAGVDVSNPSYVEGIESSISALERYLDAPKPENNIPGDYLVRWCFDIEDATSPLLAAKKARAMMLKPDSEAVVFEVEDKNGEITTVDLLLDVEESPIGLTDALHIALQGDKSIHLWEANIGLFSSDTMYTPFSSQRVIVASNNKESASLEAINVAKKMIPAPTHTTFTLLNIPNELNLTEFLTEHS